MGSLPKSPGAQYRKLEQLAVRRDAAVMHGTADLVGQVLVCQVHVSDGIRWLFV